jgi:hypothetical protein
VRLLKNFITAAILCLLSSFASASTLSEQGCIVLGNYTYAQANAVLNGTPMLTIPASAPKEVQEIMKQILISIPKIHKQSPEFTAEQFGVGFIGFCMDMGGDTNLISKQLSKLIGEIEAQI